VAAYGRGDYRPRFGSAAAGRARAMRPRRRCWGSCHALGRGVPQDFAAALTWYRRRPTRAWPQRPIRPRADVRPRLRGEADYAAALTWYRKAADPKASPAADINLGLMYARQGWPKDARRGDIGWQGRRPRRPPRPIHAGGHVRQWRGRCRRISTAPALGIGAAATRYADAQYNLGLMYERQGRAAGTM